MAKILKKHFINTVKKEYYKYNLLHCLCFAAILFCIILAYFTYGISLIFIIPTYFLIKKLKKQKGIYLSGANGEEKSLDILKNLSNNYFIIPDVTLHIKHKTAQIDNIVIGPSGIFIIENKNHSGIISGDISSKYLVKEKRGEQSQIYNPVFQVNTHLKLLKELLSYYNVNEEVFGIVFFSNRKTVLNLSGQNSGTYVFSYSNQGDRKLLNYIKNAGSNINTARIKRIKKIIYSNCT